MLGTHCSSPLTDPIAAYRRNFTNIGIFPGYVELPSCSVPVLSVLPSDTWVKSEHSPGPHPEPGHVFKLCPRSKSAVFFSANNQLTDNCAELFQKWVSEWVSSFLTAHQHIISGLRPQHGSRTVTQCSVFEQWRRLKVACVWERSFKFSTNFKGVYESISYKQNRYIASPVVNLSMLITRSIRRS